MGKNPDRVWQPREGRFDRQRDLLFNFFGRPAWKKRNHGDLRVRDVGKGFYRKIFEGNNASHDEQQRAKHDKQWLVQRIVDQAFHWLARAAEAE